MAILSAFLDRLTERVFDWNLVGVSIGAWLVGQILYDEFFAPGSDLPGIRPRFLTRFIVAYHIFKGSILRHNYSLSKSYGKIYAVGPGLACVADIDATRMLFTQSKSVKSDIYKSFEGPRENIFTTQDPALHRKLRRATSPVFSLASLNNLEPLIHEVGVKRLVARVSEYAETGKTFDVMELLHYTTLDVIGAVSFSGSFNTLTVKPGEKPHPITRWINDFTTLGAMRLLFGPLCNRLTFPRLLESEKNFIEFARSAILGHMANQLESEDKDISEGSGKDVLQRLIESEDPETGEKLDVDQLIAESMIQLLAGTSTSSLTATWTLHLLHDHPDVTRKLYEELKESLPDRHQTIQHNAVKNLPYLNATLYESMRMQSVSGATMRKSPPGGVDLCGYHVPEGWTITASPYAIHNSKEVYGDDADTFRPDRWIEADPEQLKLMRRSFMAFSMGLRACNGQNLAWMELRLFIATLVRQFEFAVPAGEETDMESMFHVTVKPRGGCYKVRATLRSD